MSSGYYPAGAENDPRAPWNQVDPVMVECPDCKGHGKHWFAYDIDKDEEIECNETTWDMLPENVDEARAKRQHFIRGEVETCGTCDGTGEVEEEADDYDDYDYYDVYGD